MAANESNIKSTFLQPIMKSAQESVLESLCYVSGRGYVNDDSVKYYMPSDAKEVVRMNRQHLLYRYSWQHNHSAPIDEALLMDARALDVGCGSGAWVVDMAREWQLSSFVGLDVASNFPTGPQKPSNAAFIQCNILERAPFPCHTFDFVRESNLITTVPQQHWMTALKAMVRMCKPSGWVEICEVDHVYYDCGPVAKRLMETLNKCCKEEEINTVPSRTIANQLEEAGLDKLCSDDRTYPVGSWSGRFGEMVLEDCLEGYRSLKPLLLRVLKVTDDEYDALLCEFSNEVNEYKTYMRAYRYWGQKPRMPKATTSAATGGGRRVGGCGKHR